MRRTRQEKVHRPALVPGHRSSYRPHKPAVRAKLEKSGETS
jgi:hypothetical protein